MNAVLYPAHLDDKYIYIIYCLILNTFILCVNAFAYIKLIHFSIPNVYVAYILFKYFVNQNTKLSHAAEICKEQNFREKLFSTSVFFARFSHGGA